MAQTKLAGAWCYEDILTFPDDGRRYEIIEGDLYEMPSPTSVHAATNINLIALLLPLVAKFRGRLFTAPLDVFIPGGDPVQPDVLVVLPDGKARVELRGVEGPPDLVIEVVSPSNRGRDLLTERSLYARAGVREYWLVDPEARTIEILALDRDAFHLAVAASGDETPVSPLLGQLPIKANELFAGIDA
ncbi:MAG TPA: Uma2 family endonuclease [Thermomicrobiales bacterium]|nr:Uma2 family endonuclease [Thermomicrobiales bacterium]